MLGWDVRLLPIGRRFHGSKSRGRLIMQRQVMEGGELHAIVEVLRSQPWRM